MFSLEATDRNFWVTISPLHALIDTKLTSEKLILQKQMSHKTKICNVS